MTFLLPGDKAPARANAIATSEFHAPDRRERASDALRKGGPAVCAGRAAGPARDEEQLSALIGDIYDAAVEPARWRGVLRQIADFVGGMSAAVYYKDATAKHG